MTAYQEPVRVGVLAIQGDVREHLHHLERAGARPQEVRTPADLDGLAGLIIPGGESTTIGMLMEEAGLTQAVRERVEREGFPVYGTCAGLILLARRVVGGPSPARIGVMDLTADRNAYGRQVASFEVRLPIPVLGPELFPAVFIRAPRITAVGPGVQVLATLDGEPVMAESGGLLVSAFHPEMSDDLRIHRYFLEKVRAFAARAGAATGGP
ncbi:glutamine amidotransferase for pyridoxal phosphate synthesis; pyridoxal 5'-phosphate synthase complex, glutamine amidotransferase subunit PdxT [Candidatus Hydrogenisulfobacillus filiaventi]|uniref:Pyridoxal 5'-phosphate synthase subunit PdxT n=1 Tax=Candidatus Hydrogenisulfobacillus filiaventi TaxID=2707344 RepID=A0A6F8ZCC6_9FIRM|nr:pyridoxal 5'-phosphate synthase glutaminase subunit PdxT [Bacillota bacterium]CAB1127516.1 glutamine amidotransferase for pyridoxal phosphate synthesis; pyridoxal 5'-phosphate synthase complex, glutamine amidotransferase subunit PdxT [Candidatus Hydrogenisulfobacillus filiaventi]